jgi:hypothetical protein
MNGLFQMQGGKKLDFTEIDQCKPVLLGLSLAGNLAKPFLSLYGTEWGERGYGLCTNTKLGTIFNEDTYLQHSKYLKS